MRVFKFGGASVKDAAGVKNLSKVLLHQGHTDTLIVVSAMGKMTNAFEKVVHAYLYQKEELQNALSYVKSYHKKLISALFLKEDVIFDSVKGLFQNLDDFMAQNTSDKYNYVYDQIVCTGELLSTAIVSAYLTKQKISNEWLDIRTIIKTDSNHRSANVDWESTTANVKKLEKNILYITQGFIGGESQGNTTTLGREGSDYTAGVLGHCLSAKSVTIWKDVPGVLNADPRVFDRTVLLEQISYQEAIEMAFYGASVIHPKTIKPLENKCIPLHVRSFENLENTGTKVSKGVAIIPKTSCFIVKRNQLLVSISTTDFSFMAEENLSKIFKQLHRNKLKVNLIQNSAISFSVCVEDNFSQFNAFYKALCPSFKIRYNTDLTMYTVRHFDAAAVDKIESKGLVLVKQSSRETIQFVLDEKNNYEN